ncbi:hypothetical protein RHIZ_22390 [Rhizobium skierniewicense]|uniref:hypothetical protein n=1 Tax=Rhizobium skierniewicense TaxID=984260 RepID=UPI001FAB971F|nr:hypothetical protein [Rhizobium skierniewicense]MCI9868709.1 hypothetical protein [Rhizobium skierniewicense]
MIVRSQKGHRLPLGRGGLTVCRSRAVEWKRLEEGTEKPPKLWKAPEFRALKKKAGSTPGRSFGSSIILNLVVIDEPDDHAWRMN